MTSTDMVARRGTKMGIGLLLAAAFMLAAGCDSTTPAPVDSGSDPDTGVPADAGTDAGPDVDECLAGAPCGSVAGATCVNTVGSYECSCPAGYAAPATGGTCADVDECADGTHDCDLDPAALCTNTVGGFTCACPADFAGDAHGVGGCLLSDGALSSLTASAGALSPAFASTTTTYTLTLLPGDADPTLTPAVAFPAHATITVDGVTVASGAASAPIALDGFAPRAVDVTATSDGGASISYTVAIRRRSVYLKASNTGDNDHFGGAVALSADGATLAVGAWREASNATGIGGDQANDAANAAGAVYVFTRAGTTWSQQAYLKASNTDANDLFGVVLALSADGSTLAVGAPSEASAATGIGGDQTSNAALAAGAVYVFRRTGISWAQQAYVKASNANADDQFGSALALSADGLTLAVGANGEDSSATGVGGDQTSAAAGASGAVYVFARAGTVWSQQAYLKASNTEAFDFFGTAVALSADGSTLAVGANGEASSATGVDGLQSNNAAPIAGAVYVFTRAATTWSQQAYLKASNTGAGDSFGGAVALSADGSTLAVGAWREASSAPGIDGDQTNDTAADAGAVYVFHRAVTAWSQQAYVKASNAESNDGFGRAVALSADGSTLATVAAGEDSDATGIGGDQASNIATNSGAAYVFRRAGTVWSQNVYLKASNTDGFDYFGNAVAVAGDGTSCAVGATGEASDLTGVGADETVNAISNAGAVYLY